MQDQRFVKKGTRRVPVKRRLLIPVGWALVVAAQRHAYDAGHRIPDPFVDYLGWSCCLWGVLTPLAVGLARRHPIDSAMWRHSVPLHLGASLLLATLQLSLEA